MVTRSYATTPIFAGGSKRDRKIRHNKKNFCHADSPHRRAQPTSIEGYNDAQGGVSMARCERCGYELNSEAERLLAELRAALARCDPNGRVELTWRERPPAEPPSRFPKGFARKTNGTEPPAA